MQISLTNSQRPFSRPENGFTGHSKSFAEAQAHSDYQDTLRREKTARNVFIVSLALGGFLAGAGIAVEIAGMREVGQSLYALGFALCAIAIVRHPKEG
jgi:hypothetical protein